jgi:hypothetical protein
MDRMEQEIAGEFREIDSVTRTALAFLNQADQSAALALLNRYAARHGREWHRAVHTLRAIQKERREPATSHQPLPTDHCISPNEPEPDLTAAPSITSDPKLATDHRPLATELATDHRPLATGILPNEPEPEVNPEPSTTSDSPLEPVRELACLTGEMMSEAYKDFKKTDIVPAP